MRGDNITLKRCPLCGSEVRFAYSMENDYPVGLSVECTECHISLDSWKIGAVGIKDRNGVLRDIAAKEFMAAFWNRRPDVEDERKRMAGAYQVKRSSIRKEIVYEVMSKLRNVLMRPVRNCDMVADFSDAKKKFAEVNGESGHHYCRRLAHWLLTPVTMPDGKGAANGN